MKRPNHILTEAARQRAKSWQRIVLGQPRQSLDHNQPPAYMIDVQGQRGDGMVFTTTAIITATKYDMLHGKPALEVAAGLMNHAMAQLMTFTGCGCTADDECEKHKVQVQ